MSPSPAPDAPGSAASGNDDRPSNPSDPTRRRALVREAGAVYLASVAITAGIVALGSVVPVVGQNALGLVALTFLYLPIFWLRRKGEDPADFGLSVAGWRRGALWGGLVTVLTVVPFAIGFHIWERVAFDHELRFDLGNYRAWPESLRLVPPDADDGLWLWRDTRRIMARCDEPVPCVLTLQTDGVLVHLGGPVPRLQPVETGASWRVVLGADLPRLTFRVDGGDRLYLDATRLDGSPLPPERIHAPGAETTDAGHLSFARSWLWIPLSLLIQLLLVALPEEFFYRGFLQGRLNAVWTRRWHLGPFHTSAPILVTSAAFALGHFAIGFDPRRLAVFFPSLAFGWLRDRTGGLVAPVVYHAACNLLVELAVVHYWPAS